MTYSIRYTPQAMQDLDRIWDDIWAVSKSEELTFRYISGITGEISSKRFFPFSGSPLQYRGLFTGFYSITYKKYKAFYRVRDGYLEVARVILAKRDYMTILFGDEE